VRHLTEERASVDAIRAALLLVIALLLTLTAAATAAQSNVTRIIVPFAAGGVQDILARAISPELGAALRRSIIVENRPGAGGTIGTASVAKAAPDGRTLILAAASHTINGSLYARPALRSDQGFHRRRAYRHVGIRADDQRRAAGEDGR
jgi:tripartite-type tricarboxylate transporter receptor subunit TctC